MDSPLFGVGRLYACLLYTSSSGDDGSTTRYTLTFETNGGSAIEKVTGKSGNTIDLSDYTPTREGYDVSGWYSDKGLTNKITEDVYKRQVQRG